MTTASLHLSGALRAGTLPLINPLEHPGWDDLVLAHPDHSFFHSSLWARTLSESYGYVPRYAARIDRGALTTVIPVMEIDSALTGRRGVSLPFSDYCEPIFPADRSWSETFAGLVRYGAQEGWRTLELRGGERLRGDVPSSAWFYRHTLDLAPGEQGVHASFRDSTRRNIRKAVREGVTVSITDSAEGMNQFYRLNCLTRRVHGLPPQPPVFFRKVQEHVISRGQGFVALALKGREAIAAAVYFHFGGRVIYKYGASDRRYLQLRPNDLVMGEAIAECCRRGYTHFCFGRTEPDNTGLRTFKNGWGTHESTIHYAKYDIRAGRFVSSGPGTGASPGSRVFRALPIPIAKLIGTLLYRHVG